MQQYNAGKFSHISVFQVEFGTQPPLSQEELGTLLSDAVSFYLEEGIGGRDSDGKKCEFYFNVNFPDKEQQQHDSK